jgi:hypothetical protein
MLESARVSAPDDRIRGLVVGPHDENWDEARRPWNLAFAPSSAAAPGPRERARQAAARGESRCGPAPRRPSSNRSERTATRGVRRAPVSRYSHHLERPAASRSAHGRSPSIHATKHRTAERTRLDHRHQQPRLRTWGEILGDAMVAAALIDRLVHHATMITLKGKSYRLRERTAATFDNPPQRAQPTKLS